jgi:processive 1,2-diacylglycerol beta-glucosyltransferase
MKKKVIIFSSLGGGGHTAVTKALKDYLSDEFEIISKNIFSEVINGYEPIRILSFGKSNAEQFYNSCITRKYYGFLSFFYKFGNFYFKCFKNKVSQKIALFLDSEKPDFVISDVPLVNNAVLKACEKLKMPFLLIPTDLDIKTFIDNIYAPTYNRFKIALPFADAEADQRIIQSKIPLEKSFIAGFVIRPDFFETKDAPTIKAQYQIPEGKQIVLLMLGAMGLETVVRFTHELIKVKHPVHLLICLGRREDLRIKINSIPLPSHITLTTIGFTDRISDLMSVADLCITKSGSVSFCETIYMNLPVILDATVEPLAWERANHRFVIRHNFGQLLEKYADLPIMVDNLLSQPDKLNMYKKNLHSMPKKHGGTEIKRIINQMLNF